jgi:hypothetical protein
MVFHLAAAANHEALLGLLDAVQRAARQLQLFENGDPAGSIVFRLHLEALAGGSRQAVRDCIKVGDEAAGVSVLVPRWW